MTFDKNKDLLAKELKKLRTSGIKHIINGQEVDSSSKETFVTTSPADGQHIATISKGTENDIDKAAKAAKEAFKEWRMVPHQERKKILLKVADNIEKYVSICYYQFHASCFIDFRNSQTLSPV